MKKNEKPLVELSREQLRAQKAKDGEPEYWRDPQLEDMGKELVQEVHEHLREAEISYLLTSKPMSNTGKTLAGKARKVSGILRYYAQSDFLIIVSNDFWQEAAIPERRALLDHEHCHCSVEYDKDGGRQWILKGHDIEEFTAIVDRRGLWHDELEKFGQAVARQLELPFDPGDPGQGKGQGSSGPANHANAKEEKTAATRPSEGFS